jgi:hypothetical protein
VEILKFGIRHTHLLGRVLMQPEDKILVSSKRAPKQEKKEIARRKKITERFRLARMHRGDWCVGVTRCHSGCVNSSGTRLIQRANINGNMARSHPEVV